MSFLNGFLDNVASGALNPKGNLADFAHAARTFVDDNHRLAPKVKFLYHVSFSINPQAASIIPQFAERHKDEISLLVKTAQLPSFNIQTDVKHQYNRKKVIQKRIDYSPVTLTFHDDNIGVTTALWEAYYRYYYRDGNYAKVGPAGGVEPINRYYENSSLFNDKQYRYGFDNDSISPFFNQITIYQMSRKRYTAFTLINPLIASWTHDTMDYSDQGTGVESSMQIEYETVHYSRGPVNNGQPAGFAVNHYDKMPSPNSLSGGGAASLLGVGGVLAGGMGVLDDITGGNVSFGTVLRAANSIGNAKSLNSKGIGQELLGSAVGALGRSQGIDVSGVAGVAFPSGGGGGNLATLATAAALSLGAKATSSNNPSGGILSAFANKTRLPNAKAGPGDEYDE